MKLWKKIVIGIGVIVIIFIVFWLYSNTGLKGFENEISNFILPENIEKIVDNERYFLAYHMNKKHWITICLDSSVDFNEICTRIDESYNLAKKK